MNPGISRLPATKYSVSMETSTPVQSRQSVLKHPITKTSLWDFQSPWQQEEIILNCGIMDDSVKLMIIFLGFDLSHVAKLAKGH